EDIFQRELRELKDPGIESRPDLAKRTVVQNSTRVLRAEAVCDVVRFASEFQPLFFTESEASRQSQIEAPRCRAADAIAAHVAIRGDGRYREGVRIQVQLQRLDRAIDVT